MCTVLCSVYRTTANRVSGILASSDSRSLKEVNSPDRGIGGRIGGEAERGQGVSEGVSCYATPGTTSMLSSRHSVSLEVMVGRMTIFENQSRTQDNNTIY